VDENGEYPSSVPARHKGGNASSSPNSPLSFRPIKPKVLVVSPKQDFGKGKGNDLQPGSAQNSNNKY